MTRLWPDGFPVEVQVNTNGRPVALCWGHRWHAISGISDHWRVDAEWWRLRQLRDYFTVHTCSGLLVIIYHELLTDRWYLLRLYD